MVDQAHRRRTAGGHLRAEACVRTRERIEARKGEIALVDPRGCPLGRIATRGDQESSQDNHRHPCTQNQPPTRQFGPGLQMVRQENLSDYIGGRKGCQETLSNRRVTPLPSRGDRQQSKYFYSLVPAVPDLRGADVLFGIRGESLLARSGAEVVGGTGIVHLLVGGGGID